MIKFQNQQHQIDYMNTGQPYQHMKYSQQQQKQKPHHQGYMQETFGQAQIRGQQNQYGGQGQSHNMTEHQQHQQQRYDRQQQQTVYQQVLQQQNKNTQQTSNQPINNAMKPPVNVKEHQGQQIQPRNMQQVKPQYNVDTEDKAKPQKNVQNQNFAGQIIQNYKDGGQPSQPQRLLSADPQTSLQKVTQHQQQPQYISNGVMQNKPNQTDYSQRQATPMKDNNQYKFLNPKTAMDQQMMYSPMPKSQLLNETTNIQKLQQCQVLQNRSPQIQKVAGSSMGAFGQPQTNAQLIVEELAREKERHQQLQQKHRKLENDKKTYNTSFLNEMETKIKLLIKQNDELQTQNMEYLQRAQNQPQAELAEVNQQLAYNGQQIEFLQKQINEASNCLNEQRNKYNELEKKCLIQRQNEEQQISYLVQDLEDKVHGLISENERLNVLIQQQENNQKKDQQQHLITEKAKLVQLVNQSAKEVQAWKQKLEQLQLKASQSKQQSETQPEQIEDLEDKIRQLIEENDYLNNMVQQQIEKENQIALLEEEMQNLVEQNDNLEQLVQTQASSKK